MNTVTFYIRDLSVHRFWYLRRVLEPIPCRLWGMTVQAYFCHCGQFEIDLEITGKKKQNLKCWGKTLVETQIVPCGVFFPPFRKDVVTLFQ